MNQKQEYHILKPQLSDDIALNLLYSRTSSPEVLQIDFFSFEFFVYYKLLFSTLFPNIPIPTLSILEFDCGSLQ
jgi:hypothetical protein